MKKTSDFTRDEIANIVKEYGNGAKVIDLGKKYNVSPNIIYYWMYNPKKKKPYCSSSVSQVNYDYETSFCKIVDYVKAFCIMGFLWYALNIVAFIYRIYLYIR